MTKPYDESISGQPYSASAGEAQPWLFNHDQDMPPTYFGQARTGYDRPNNVPWPSTLPPPMPPGGDGGGGDPGGEGGSGGGGKKRGWVARHKFWTALAAVGVLAAIGTVAGGGDDPAPKVALPAASDAGQTGLGTPGPQPTIPSVAPAPVPPVVQKPAVKAWHRVTVLSGSGNKRGPLFTVGQNRTRLTYTVKANDFALVSVYVMEEGTSLAQDGGFPEVTVTDPGTDSTELAGGPGRYYLDVSAANARWTVTVEELR